MKRPFFSFIIPVFNAEKYLDACLKSIINQVYTNYEVIIVDDGSSDSSPSICDNYATTYTEIRVFHTINNGVVRARQKGVEEALGDYIVFVDSDDWIDKNLLSKFNESITKYNCDVVVCGYYEASEEKLNQISTIFSQGYYDNTGLETCIFPKLICSEYGQALSPQLWAKAFRKELYQKHQLVDSVVVMGEDIACSMAAIANSRSLVIINIPLYYYRQNQESVSNIKKALPWDGPMLRTKHLVNHTKNSTFDFLPQINRDCVLGLFTVVRSHFLSSMKNEDKEMTKKQLSNVFYSHVLDVSFFKKLKYQIILMALKKRWYWFFYLYNKVR